MTDSLNRRRRVERTVSQHAAPKLAESQRRRGTYTDRYDRPHPAPRPEGTYVSGARQTSARGSYTDVDGALHRPARPEGFYTLRG